MTERKIKLKLDSFELRLIRYNIFRKLKKDRAKV